MSKALFVLSSLFLFQNSQAVLGEKAESVQTVRAAMKATSQKVSAASTTAAKWTVQETKTDGMTIKEYVDADGNVFAVSWRGINKPDLSLLLGQYFEEFSAAEKEIPKKLGRQPVQVKGSHVTVRRSGHQRDMRGFAYLPDKLPNGVTVEELTQ